MDDLFTEVEVTNEDDGAEALKQYAEKFGIELNETTEKIVRSKYEADKFIEQMKREQEELRTELNKQLTLEQIMTEIKASKAPVEPSTPQEPRQPGETQTPDIEKLVSDLLERKKNEEKAMSNTALVDQKLKESFGLDAARKVNEKARELGMTLSELKEQAVRNPKAFFKLMDMDKAPSTTPAPTAPRSSVSTPPANSGGRDKAYYERLKAQDRAKYFSPATQVQMYKDMEKVLLAGGTW